MLAYLMVLSPPTLFLFFFPFLSFLFLFFKNYYFLQWLCQSVEGPVKVGTQ